MKNTPFSTLIAGAATGAVITFLVFGRDVSPGEPAVAPATESVRSEQRPLQRPTATLDTPTGPAVVVAARDEAAPQPAASEPAASRPLSDADLRSWMDTSLDSGYADRTRSGLASEQLQASLAEFAGVQLTDVQCGSDFCRASLQAQAGVKVDVSRLFGLAPLAFSSGGFSVEEPDGSTKIYFVHKGQSLDDLRQVARGAL